MVSFGKPFSTPAKLERRRPIHPKRQEIEPIVKHSEKVDEESILQVLAALLKELPHEEDLNRVETKLLSQQDNSNQICSHEDTSPSQNLSYCRRDCSRLGGEGVAHLLYGGPKPASTSKSPLCGIVAGPTESQASERHLRKDQLRRDLDDQMKEKREAKRLQKALQKAREEQEEQIAALYHQKKQQQQSTSPPVYFQSVPSNTLYIPSELVQALQVAHQEQGILQPSLQATSQHNASPTIPLLATQSTLIPIQNNTRIDKSRSLHKSGKML